MRGSSSAALPGATYGGGGGKYGGGGGEGQGHWHVHALQELDCTMSRLSSESSELRHIHCRCFPMELIRRAIEEAKLNRKSSSRSGLT